jgi:2-iminobutanoate/2-iminopropanoate deaminase
MALADTLGVRHANQGIEHRLVLSLPHANRAKSRRRSGRFGHLKSPNSKGYTMFKIHNPPDVLPLVGPLSWGLELPAPKRFVYVSGQVGADVNGRVGEGLLEQAQLAFDNVAAVLRSAGLTPQHVIRTGLYFTRHVEMIQQLQTDFNAIRTGFMGEHRATSTWLFVHALADPRWLFEIDAIAAEF